MDMRVSTVDLVDSFYQLLFPAAADYFCFNFRADPKLFGEEVI